MDLCKGWETGRNDNMQEDYPRTKRWWKRKTTLPNISCNTLCTNYINHIGRM